jgi:hypothetical protein
VVHVPESISVLCVFMFLQTMIKELNLKFKTKENPRGIKKETTISQLCIQS